MAFSTSLPGIVTDLPYSAHFCPQYFLYKGDMVLDRLARFGCSLETHITVVRSTGVRTGMCRLESLLYHLPAM